MDSNLSGDSEVKAEFRKLSNDVANRKYRRHSPATGSSSSDGSHEQSFSPISPRNDVRKISEHERRKDDNKELDRDSGRTRYKSGDSHRHSDQHVSRNSRGYSRHDDSSRREKHADIEKRHYQTSSHSGREPRVATHFERTREESDHSRARDFTRNADKYSRDRYDSSGHRSKDKDKDLSPDTAGSDRKNFNSASGENSDWRRRDRDSRDGKRDYRKNYSDHRSDRARYHEESRGYRTDFSGREDDGHHVRDSYKNDVKNLDGQREKKKNEKESSKDKDCQSRASWEQKEDTSDENHDSMSKKPKLFTSDRDSDYRRDDERKQSSSSKQAVTITNNLEVDNDLNAAKVAALKAAELVNRNLVGTGFMSTEQKKKLLWGSKKSTTSEESGRRWDSALFDDRERQEKFNKLMSLRLPWYLWPIVGCEGGCECGAQDRQPGCREAKGTPDGFREAVHCWTSTKRWPNCWIRSLSICLTSSACSTILSFILLYSTACISTFRLCTLVMLDKICFVVGHALF